jgi:hypothetical protein
MSGVPADVKAKILYGNAEKLYGFDTVAAKSKPAVEAIAAE